MTQTLDDPRYYVNEDKEMYDDLVSQYGEEAVDAFIDNFDVSDLKYFEEAYRGQYDNEEQFAEDFVDQLYDTRDIPPMVINNVDWEVVWNTELQFDYIFDEGYVFSRNF